MNGSLNILKCFFIFLHLLKVDKRTRRKQMGRKAPGFIISSSNSSVYIYYIVGSARSSHRVNSHEFCTRVEKNEKRQNRIEYKIGALKLNLGENQRSTNGKERNILRSQNSMYVFARSNFPFFHLGKKRLLFPLTCFEVQDFTKNQRVSNNKSNMPALLPRGA